jgi:hypothetical protein
MALQSLMFTLALALWFQENVPPVALLASDCLNASEKKRLSAEDKIDGRVKVYRDISERFHETVESDVGKQSFNEASSLVRCWMDVVASSLKDIETNINRKKKSGALINYEIQLRKSIVDMGDARLKVPYQQQGDFESWLTQAKAAHTKFVDILFQR